MSDQLKAITQQFAEAFSRGDIDYIEREILAENVAVMFPGMPGPLDRDGYRRVGETFLSAFPGCRLTVVDQVAEGDKVATTLIFEGKQQGELNGIPATGRSVRVPSMVIDRYENNKIVERWEVYDTLGLLVQLGVIPMPT